MKVLREVTSLTANRLVHHFLHPAEWQLLFQTIHGNRYWGVDILWLQLYCQS